MERFCYTSLVGEFPKTHPSHSDVHDVEGNIVMLIFFVSGNTSCCKLVLKWLGDGRDIKRTKQMSEFIVLLLKYHH